MEYHIFDDIHPDDDCLTTARAAKILGVTAVSVIRWIEAGRIRAHRTPGGHRRIRINDLLSFMNGQKVKNAPNNELIRVLIVDDDDLVRASLAKLFKTSGIKCIVETASSGFEAGFKASSMTPDLIILDVVMPGIDGIGVCDLLRNSIPASKAAILLLSAYVDDETIKDALDAGADAIISKPAKPSEIINISLEILSLERKNEISAEIQLGENSNPVSADI